MTQTDSDGRVEAGFKIGANGTPASGAWHATSIEEVFKRLRTPLDGLSDKEAARRLAVFGPNRLPQSAPCSALVRFLAQFHNLLIYVLLAAAAVTAALGHAIDTAVILLVVLVNALIGFIQEGRAEKALDAIRGMLTLQAAVLRNGRRLTVRAEELVPGDVVLIEAGDRVPADLRLIRARNLKIDESALTGESAPVDKNVNAVAVDAALGDRSSMAFSGTLAVAGQARGIAVATAINSELGRISAMLGAVEVLTTPLVRQMNAFARQLTAVILAVSALVFVFAVWFRSYDWPDAFMAVVGLAVAAIPEGLPAVITITLAVGVQRMAMRKAITRRLHAVETLGSVSVICSDKTGTLTCNEMTVRHLVTGNGEIAVTGAGYEPHGSFRRDGREIDVAQDPILGELARAALLCNDASLRRTETGWTIDGDPMEGALVSFAVKAGYDAEATRRRFARIDEIPFDARHRFMATLHDADENGAVAYIKGAPEQLLWMCTAEHTAAGPRPLQTDAWLRRIDRLADEGMRVLAIAVREMPRGAQALSFGDVERSTLLGLVGLIDPPREEAPQAVAECKEAGIRVKMITGDHVLTARAISRQLGLGDHEAVVAGSGLDGLDESAFRRIVRSTAVFARTSPEQKLRIVEALQAEGEVVAMTGDGVNDAPALRRADVGIAMGRKGTEAAKEAAEMVLADDNFASIVAAVREGRTVYDNLMKVIGWTLPTNGGEAAAIVTAILLGVTLPITPVQILWINMITAVGLGLALAFEPTEPEAMRRPPRPRNEPILSKLLIWRVIFVSLLFVLGAFGIFFWALERGLPIEEARTMVVNTIVAMEIFYLFSIRYRYATSLTWAGLLGTPAVLAGVASVTAAQLLFTYAPFMQTMFETRSMSFRDGFLIVGAGVTLFVVLEAEKLIRRRLGFQVP